MRGAERWRLKLIRKGLRLTHHRKIDRAEVWLLPRDAIFGFGVDEPLEVRPARVHGEEGVTAPSGVPAHGVAVKDAHIARARGH